MRETLMFYGEIFRRWRTTGAVAPSGQVLARAMADAVGTVAPGQVILELGPGTGVFTRELVRRFPAARVVAVELNERFAAHLRGAVPGATVVNGCATRLDAHLAGLGCTPADVAAVVSGLPLLVLPGDLPRRVFGSVAGCCGRAGGSYNSPTPRRRGGGSTRPASGPTRRAGCGGTSRRPWCCRSPEWTDLGSGLRRLRLSAGQR